MLRLIWASICGLLAVGIIILVIAIVGFMFAWLLPVAILGGVFMVVFAVVYTAKSKSQLLKDLKELI